MASLQVTPEKEGSANVGIVGIGVMGSNLALNLLNKGFCVAVWNLETEVTEKFVAEWSPTLKVVGAETYADFARLLAKPRKALILVTAGKATDSVIDSLMDVFEAEDVIVDTGNAHFKDQSKRAARVEARGMRFLGMGISGGAEGARKGPAFFPGGTLSVWEDIKDVIESASAKAADGRPCATMCGSGGAGSCVKMYHNAGEYAVLQIWAEAVSSLKGLGLDNPAIQGTLAAWKARGPMDSYMLDITLEVAGKRDAELADGSYLMEHTADMIGSKGTGLWSVQEALEVGVPIPSLAQAVVARQMSMCRPERLQNSQVVGDATSTSAPVLASAERDGAIEDLYWAVYLSMVASYAQMFQALRAIDAAYDMDITPRLPRIISTFRAGCILQGALLEPMTQAFESNSTLSNLFCAFGAELREGMPRFRAACARLALGGEPAGVMQASLTYLATMAQPTLCAGQVVSLQRDVFGRHGFRRLRDGKATEESFNAEWREMLP